MDSVFFLKIGGHYIRDIAEILLEVVSEPESVFFLFRFFPPLPFYLVEWVGST